MNSRKPRRGEVAPDKPVPCPLCGGRTAPRLEMRQFEYGVGDLRTPVAVQVSTHACEACGACIDGPEAGAAMEDAGRRAIGMLVGEDFRRFREEQGLSVRELSRLTGIGTATLSRWERGRLRPNRSLDLLMQILRDVPGAAAYARNKTKMPVEVGLSEMRFTGSPAALRAAGKYERNRPRKRGAHGEVPRLGAELAA